MVLVCLPMQPGRCNTDKAGYSLTNLAHKYDKPHDHTNKLQRPLCQASGSYIAGILGLGLVLPGLVVQLLVAVEQLPIVAAMLSAASVSLQAAAAYLRVLGMLPSAVLAALAHFWAVPLTVQPPFL